MEKKKKTKKKIIIGIVIFIVLIIGIGSCGDSDSSPANPEKLAKEYSIEVALAEDFISSCEKIDIEYGEIEISEMTQEKVAFSYDEYLFDATCADNKVTTIASGTITFYDPANDVIVPIWDRLVTSDELATISVRSETLVKSVLKAPSTAEFPSLVTEQSEWNVRQNGERYIVTSWVDAENSFGAMVRSNYAIAFNWDGSEDTEPEVESFIFDGETII